LAFSSLSVVGSPFKMAQTSLADASKGPVCIIQVPNGTLVLSQSSTGDSVIYPDGTTHNLTCASTGYPLSATGVTEVVQQYNSGGFRDVSGLWSVPSAPANNGGQMVALWNGIEDSSGDVYQPVLAWGCQSTFLGVCTQGGTFWWMSAEYCDVNTNSCTSTSAVSVSVSNQMDGTVQFQFGCGSNHNLDSYVLTVKDTTKGTSTSETLCTTTAGFDYVVGGALEVQITFTSCNGLPNVSSETFSSISETPTISSWSGQYNTGAPSCSYSPSGTTSPSQTALLKWTP
jgi:hypothetical protein